VEDPETGFHYGIGLDPEVKSLVGNQMVPYIYEDFISHETLAKAFMKMYELGEEGRKDLGAKAMNYVHKNYDLEKMISDWDTSLTKLIDDWKSGKKQKWTYKEI